MINELLKIFNNYTRSLEILYLLNDIKKSARLDADEAELKKIKDFCASESLYLEISDFKVIRTADAGKGGYANMAKRVPVNYTNSGLCHIYISKDKNKAKFLKFLESKNDDKAIGEFLGYPECCINFFIKNKEKQQKIQNDFILPALRDSEGFRFPFYTNYAIRYFDFTLLSHFPHDFHCEESIKIAKKNLECVKNCSEELTNKFEEMLKCAVLYTENNGVFMLRDYRLNNTVLDFSKVLSTVNNGLLELLNKNKKIEIISKNEVRIKNNALKDVGVMVFG